jgi:hypothetical protein
LPAKANSGRSTQRTIPGEARATGPRPETPAGRRRWLPFRLSKWREINWLGILPFALIALAVGFNLWTLRAQRSTVAYVNDGAVHLAMVDWARRRILAGHLPFDGWFSYLGLGVPQFSRYQSLPHVITGAVAVLFGSRLTYAWSLYLLLALWPLAVYWGSRLLGWGRWTSALAAGVSPLIMSTLGLGYGVRAYSWQGYGVWSQLWSMWLLPIALGLGWRAIKRGRGYALAAGVIALTIVCHLITGYLALLILGAWALFLKPSEFWRRVRRGVLVGAGAVVAASYSLVPLIGSAKFATQDDRILGTSVTDSYGARRILGWLFTGHIFDEGHFPVITILAGVGTAVCIARWRRDERGRALLVAGAVSLVLFFGRPTLGPVLRFMPFSGSLLLRRFIVGVHLMGIILAGVGAAWIGGMLLRLAERRFPTARPAAVMAALAAVFVAVLAPAWVSVASYDQKGVEQIRYEKFIESADGVDVVHLIQEAESLGPGRIYGGMDEGWGHSYRVGQVNVYLYLPRYRADAVSRAATPSLSRNVEERFDDTDPGQYTLFDVRYLIFPAGRVPTVRATVVAKRGSHVLWRVTGKYGYAQVVDAGPPVTTDHRTLAQAMRPFLISQYAGSGPYPTVAYAGLAPAPPTYSGSVPAVPGHVLNEVDHSEEGLFEVRVSAERTAMVALKASFDPRWRVTVDGKSEPPQMIGPSFVGREVPAGIHTVVFQYRPYSHYLLLWVVGALALLALALGPRLWKREHLRRAVVDQRPGRSTEPPQ